MSMARWWSPQEFRKYVQDADQVRAGNAEAENTECKLYWVEVWGPYRIAADGSRHPLEAEDLVQTALARKQTALSRKFPALAYMQVDGWQQGEKYSLHFGSIIEDGVVKPKMDCRWYSQRGPVLRYPHLQQKLILRLESRSFTTLWQPPLVPMGRDQIVQSADVRRMLRWARHPRLMTIYGTMERRRQHCENEWRQQRSLHSPCPWCGEPTANFCYGLDKELCRTPLCNDCEGCLLRCPACTCVMGMPPAWSAASGVSENMFYNEHCRAMLHEDFYDVWDGLSAPRSFHG